MPLWNNAEPHASNTGSHSAFGSQILATTLGETAGDTVTMTWLRADVVVNLGVLVGSAIFLSVLIVLVGIQIATKKFHPFLYWAVIVASTTAGQPWLTLPRALWVSVHRGITDPVRPLSWPYSVCGDLVAWFNFGGDRQYA